MATKTKRKRTSQPVQCPYCEHIAKSSQGLTAHMRFQHSTEENEEYHLSRGAGADYRVYPDDDGQVEPPVGELTGAAKETYLSSSREVKAAENRCRLLELAKREQKLTTELNSGPTRYPDLSETAGLGELSPGIKNTLQERAFNANASGGQSPLMQMAQDAEALD
ncbi:unnamed protein product, partial [marine sediment metagenome]